MFDHEKLDVYQVSLEFVSRANNRVDELMIMKAMYEPEINEGKGLLHRIESMLTKLTE